MNVEGKQAASLISEKTENMYPNFCICSDGFEKAVRKNRQSAGAPFGTEVAVLISIELQVQLAVQLPTQKLKIEGQMVEPIA